LRFFTALKAAQNDEKLDMCGLDKMVKSKGPQFIRFFKPIIEVLKETGGSGTVSEVIDRVIEKMKIPESEQIITLKGGQSRVRNQIQWARFYLAQAGIIDSSKRGIWSLTDKGLSTKTEDTTFDVLSTFKMIHKRFEKAKKPKDHGKLRNDLTDDEEIGPPDH